MRFESDSPFAKLLFAGVTILTFFVASAVAEDASGKFSLKHPVRWGSVVMPAGDYTYSLEHHASAMLLVRNANGQPGFLVMAKSVSSANDLQPDRLILQRDGNDWFVRSIVLSSIGETLHFPVPASHTQVASASDSGGIAALSKP